MKGKQWKRVAAMFLAGGMTLSQPAGALAAVKPAEITTQKTKHNEPGKGEKENDKEKKIDPVTGLPIEEDEVEEIKKKEDAEAGIPDEDEKKEETSDQEKPGTDEKKEDTSDQEEPEPDEGKEDSKEDAETKEDTEEAENPEDTEEAENPEDTENAEEAKNLDNVAEEETKPEAAKEEPASGQNRLIRSQRFVKPPTMVEDFRFWTVARKYAFAKDDIEIMEELPSELIKKASEKSEISVNVKKLISGDAGAEEIQGESKQPEQIQENNSRVVGHLKKDGILYILREEEYGWLYVESGIVRGFVRASDVVTDEEAQTQLTNYQRYAKARARSRREEYTGIESVAPVAQAVIAPQENKAYTYLRATVEQTMAEKLYALANAEQVAIREGQSEETRVVGTMAQGTLCYILANEEQEWVYVESNNVRGFVRYEELAMGEEVTKQVEETGEKNFAIAQALIKPEENQALYYTLTSVNEGRPLGAVREALLEFAAQFIGNPYVWGGTSLTDGADCSGFVQSVFREFGYELPRVAEAQANYGTKIAVADAQPGDLIFYADSTGYIYHVVIYAGNGRTIEAANSDVGIIYGTVNYNDAVWATHFLEEGTESYEKIYTGGGIANVNATEDMYGIDLGTFKITYYCACEICCDVETGITASGAPVVEGRTIAVDPTLIPYGTRVIINGHVYTAEDCGGAIKDKRIDIYVSDHQKALQLGVGQAEVYLVK